ncbi:MAG: D-alanyl-D-alanine carboxypeptidase/D-alanyl-D-alanine endopeptidase [Gaiellaceae bacterium]
MHAPRRTLRRLPLVLLVAVLLVPVSAAGSPQRHYRVRAGDTLTSIAHRFRTSVSTLARLNHLDPNGVLPIGRLLELPSKPASAAPRLYRVRAGDTLTSIARRFGTSVAALAKENRLNPGSVLPIGKLLRLPAGGVKTPPVVPQGGAPGPAPPGSFSPLLRRRLTLALRSRGLRGVSVGAAVLDLRSGDLGYVRNGGMPLSPASPEKLAVAYTALRVLGPEFRIETDVLGQGVQQGSTWRGDIVLRGRGDPTLVSEELRRLAQSLLRRGIRAVQGSVVGDESYFDAARTVTGWKPEFYKGESPPLSALSVDRGVLDGGLADRPALAAATAFTRILRAEGVRVRGAPSTGVADPGATLLARLASPTLAQIISSMDLESDNFTAELLLKQLGAHELGRGSSAGGAEVVRRTLSAAGVPLDGVAIVDGSGLSQDDRMTARALVSILAAALRSASVRSTLPGSLPLAGVSGTLARRLLSGPAHAFVRAKTGSTDIASALVGYAGSRYAFAILMNARPWIDATRAHVAQDRFAQLVARLARAG